MDYEMAVGVLTMPGAMFEVAVETVGGRDLKMFKNRERSLREKVAKASSFGDVDFLVTEDTRIGYREFTELVWGAAGALQREHGFNKGDRLAILAMNRPEWLIALFGAASIGGIGVGLNGWWTADELVYAMNDSGSRFLIVDAKLYPRIEPVLGQLRSLETVFFIGENPPSGTVPIAPLLQRSREIPDVELAETDPFVILYTSGTTGRAKGCISTHLGTIAQVNGVIYSALLTSLTSGQMISSDDPEAQRASLLTSPLFHVAGLHSSFCVALTTGAKVVFGPPKFEPEAIMRLIQNEKVNQWTAIPTMLHRVVNHERIGDYDLSTLRAVTLGGAPTPPETMTKALAVLPIKPVFGNSYGLTETHGGATLNAGPEYLNKRESAGRPLPIVDVRIVDEAGHDVEPGETGQILFGGPTITPGYWGNAEATAEAIVDGWLQTGDVGYVDADGFLFLVDRAKDMIIRGGENVYCVEVENCLAGLAGVDEAAIIGMPDVELGERVKAVVVRTAGSAVTAEACQAHVAAHLARFKVPDVVEFRDEALPRNPSGKLLKNVLKGGVTRFVEPE